MNNMLSSDGQFCYFLIYVGVVLVLFINLLTWVKDKINIRNFSKTTQVTSSLPTSDLVSILAAAWNEGENIQKHIESFLTLRYQNKELILCAGGTDDTYQIAAGYSSENFIILKQHPSEGKQNALRRCFEKASGSVIFLTDGDCFLDDASFERTIAPILLENENITSGFSCPTPEKMRHVFVASQAVPQLYGNLRSGKYLKGILGRNCAIRTEVLEKTRAFDVPASTGTDYILAKTLSAKGYKIRNVSQSLVQSNYPMKVSNYIHQQWRWAKNVYFHGKQFGEIGEVRQVRLNAIAGLLMLVLPFSFLFGFNLIAVVCILLFLHALFSRWRYVFTVKRGYGLSMPTGILLFQPLMLIIDFIAWASPLPNYILNTGKERW